MTFFKWLAIAFVFSLSSGPACAGDAATYLLGPQDRLMIRVQTFRKNVGEAFAWPSLNGEFSVGANGALSLPLLGDVVADGMTASALGELISKTLQKKANLADLPSTSVEVVKYRPFYILGAVEQPGKYEFVPGLSVLQAVSIAQGLLRADDLTSAQRDLVTAGGELQLRGAERVSIEVKLARLDAEVKGASSLVFPTTITEKSYDPRIVQAMQDEALRFEARRGALQGQLQAVAQSKVLLQRELQSLEAKLKALDGQFDKTGAELKTVNALVAKGLAVTARQLAAEAAQMQVENNRLDTQLALLRAQQGLTQSERELVELPAQYRMNALDELTSTRALLEENTQRLATAGKMLGVAELNAAGTGREDVDPNVRYLLTRSTPTGPISRVVSANDILQAGDVLQVKIIDSYNGDANGQNLPVKIDGEPNNLDKKSSSN